MPKEKVAAQIETAFAHTPSPGKSFEDISATKWDEGIVDYFRGNTWRGHRVEDLRYHAAALSFFTDRAFRYWLPAFMLAELERPVEADVIAEGIAFHLTKSESADARIRQFTKGELEAIAAFLNECAQRYEDGTLYTQFRKAERSVRARIKKA